MDMQPGQGEKDLYGLLNASKLSTKAEIKEKYMHLAKRLHPDKNSSDSDSSLFQQVQAAYKILYDENARAIYDEYGMDAVFIYFSKKEQFTIGDFDRLSYNYREKMRTLLQLQTEAREQKSFSIQGMIQPRFSIIQPGTDTLTTLIVRSVQGQQKMNFHLSDYQDVRLTTALFTPLNPSKNPVGLANLSVSHALKLSSIFEIENSIQVSSKAKPLALSTKLSRQISSVLQVCLNANISFEELDLNLEVSRKLSTSVEAVNHISTKGYILELVHSKQVSSELYVRNSVEFEAGAAPGMNLKNVFAFGGIVYNFSVGLGLTKVFLEAGFETNGKNLVQSGVSLSLNPMHGASLSFKLRRQQMYLILPVQLGAVGSSKEKIALVAGLSVLHQGLIYWYKKQQTRVLKLKLKTLRSENMAYNNLKGKLKAERLALTGSAVQDPCLVVLSAVYGSLQGKHKTYIDVTEQLSALVQDDELSLPNEAKSTLFGFYDVCEEKRIQLALEHQVIKDTTLFGMLKSAFGKGPESIFSMYPELWIRYKFGNLVFEKKFNDIEPVAIPEADAFLLGRYSKHIDYCISLKSK
eukprot:snap_masked-scaffold_9-processed-gene-3.15-mRNA-1 protein AED:0.44 eAED:0.44 QI:0/0/0/0.5/1/1/2/0/578